MAMGNEDTYTLFDLQGVPETKRTALLQARSSNASSSSSKQARRQTWKGLCQSALKKTRRFESIHCAVKQMWGFKKSNEWSKDRKEVPSRREEEKGISDKLGPMHLYTEE
jgi:hypothetical protein